MKILNVEGNILPWFFEDGKANAESSREGRPEKDKNIQNIENTQVIWKVILFLKLSRFCVFSVLILPFMCVQQNTQKGVRPKLYKSLWYIGAKVRYRELNEYILFALTLKLFPNDEWGYQDFCLIWPKYNLSLFINIGRTESMELNFVSRRIDCVDYFFCEIRFKVKTIFCVDNLFLNPNLRWKQCLCR